MPLYTFSFVQSYLLARSFREKGLLIDLKDFTCAPMLRDLKWVSALVLVCYAWSFVMLLLVRLWTRKKISSAGLVYCYCFVQAITIFAPVVFLYATPTAPLPSAVLLMVAIVLALKMHSYFATNYAMYQEHVRRYGELFPLIAAVKQFAEASPANSSDGSVSKLSSASSSTVRRRRKKASRTGGARDNKHPDEPASDEEEGDDEYDAEDNDQAAQLRKHRFSTYLEAAAAAKSPNSPVGHAPTGFKVTMAPFSNTSPPVLAHEEEPVNPVMKAVAEAYISGTPAQQRKLIKSWPDNVTFRDFAFFLAVSAFVTCLSYLYTGHDCWICRCLRLCTNRDTPVLGKSGGGMWHRSCSKHLVAVSSNMLS
jgi:hypothetical protein